MCIRDSYTAYTISTCLPNSSNLSSLAFNKLCPQFICDIDSFSHTCFWKKNIFNFFVAVFLLFPIYCWRQGLNATQLASKYERCVRERIVVDSLFSPLFSFSKVRWRFLWINMSSPFLIICWNSDFFTCDQIVSKHVQTALFSLSKTALTPNGTIKFPLTFKQNE